MTSRECEFSFIPFGRVLSELFIKKGIVKEVQMSGLTEALETSVENKVEDVKCSETHKKRKCDP